MRFTIDRIDHIVLNVKDVEITAAPPDEVIAHLHDCGVTILMGPVEKTGALGPIRSVYCRDPDGNLVEVSSYLAL